jgi:hypothetical protein
MSFQAYIDNITKLTQKTPEQIRTNAMKKGVIKEDMKASDFVNWLSKEYKLGRGHAMALWKYFIDNQWIKTKHTKI